MMIAMTSLSNLQLLVDPLHHPLLLPLLSLVRGLCERSSERHEQRVPSSLEGHLDLLVERYTYKYVWYSHAAVDWIELVAVAERG